jgi:tetratricopeptide (TPR) repeat protein
VDRLAELAASIERDPAGVAREVHAVADTARLAEDWHTVSRAQAVLGRAWRMLGEIDLAQQALADAIVTAHKSGDDELEADAHLGLAGALSAAGRQGEAFGHLDVVDRLGSESLRDRAELQRAVLCRDVGRLDEALALFTRAEPRLRHAERWLDLARVLANSGGILMSRGDVAAAIGDYEEAESLFGKVGQDFVALQVRHDLGCAAANLGDLPRALQLFDEVSTRFAELGHDASVPLLSRAEALMLGGLTTDALAFSRDAARRLDAEGNQFAAAQALVTVGAAARLEGDFSAARDAVERAKAGFAAGEAAGWQRAAELEAMRLEHDDGGLDASAMNVLDDLAEALCKAGDVRGEIQARCLLAVSACERQGLRRAERQLGLAATAVRHSGLMQPRVTLHHARATTCLASGDLVGARRQLRRAFADLDATRSLLGGDADSAIDTQARSVTQLAIRLAARELRPMLALAWIERARLVGRVSRPALPPADDRSGGDFARLRVAAGDLRRAEFAGEPTDELRRRHAELERSMRAEWLKVPQPAGARRPLPKLSELKRVVGDAQVVSIASSGDSLLAVVADRRNVRSYVLGGPAAVVTAAQRAGAAHGNLAVIGAAPAVTAARQRTFAAAVDVLDSLLLAPLHLDSAHVVLVVPAELHAIPWAALASLQGRSFTLAPSVTWWIEATTMPSPKPESVLVVAGPRLAEAEAEARGVAACHGRATLLLGQEATVANVGAAMCDHDIVHFVAHGRFRHDNPLWSTLELADGPLTVYEMQRLGRVPPVVVLATCDSGLDGVRNGAQLHGLAGTLLTMGARTIVAAIGALPDTIETRQTMIELHRDVIKGISPSASLARQRAAASDEASGLTAAGLVTLGVG